MKRREEQQARTRVRIHWLSQCVYERETEKKGLRICEAIVNNKEAKGVLGTRNAENTTLIVSAGTDVELVRQNHFNSRCVRNKIRKGCPILYDHQHGKVAFFPIAESTTVVYMYLFKASEGLYS